MFMKKIGVVAIAFNESVDLPGFLAHLVSWVDEIIIIDDGSTDNSRRIAADFGDKVKFIQNKRKKGEYFSHQRNKGIKIATSDWLLHMDIDERVSSELSREIIEAINTEKYDAYKFRRLNYFFHRPMKGGGWSDWNLVHLARRDVLNFSGMFHEKIELSVGVERVGQLVNKMHHFNDKSYRDRLSKSLIYQEELVSYLEKKQIRISYFNLLLAVIKEFVIKFIYKKGFRDGLPGFISAFHSCFAVFRSYVLVWENQNKIERTELEKLFGE